MASNYFSDDYIETEEEQQVRVTPVNGRSSFLKRRMSSYMTISRDGTDTRKSLGDRIDVLEAKMDILSEMTEEIRDMLKSNNRPGTKVTITVPAHIRAQVHEAYSDGLKSRGLSWATIQKSSFTSDRNMELTQYIKDFVKGRCPEVNQDVLHAAVKRYFTSQKEKTCRIAANKEQGHKKKQASYERKREKAKRRKEALEHKKSLNPEKKKKYREALEISFMSSDEESEDDPRILNSRPYEWLTEEFTRMKRDLDQRYIENCSKRSSMMMALKIRQIGAPSEKPVPVVPANLSWILKK